MRADAAIGEGLQADDGVVIDYRPERGRGGRLSLGESARLRIGTIIYSGSTIGAGLQTGHHVVIREECTIGDDVSIWSNSVIDYGCVIGRGVKIHCNCYVAQFTEIGDRAFLAPGVTIANDLHPGHPASADMMSGPLIEPDAQIGVNATILPFVTIGQGAIVGAGAVVTRDVPERTVAYGCPAEAVGPVDDLEDIAQRIEPVEGKGTRFRLRNEVSAG